MLPHAADSIEYLRNLSPAKMVNAARVLGSYYSSRITGRAAHRGMPISVSVEPTTSCNLRCPECPSGLRSFTRPTGMLSRELFEEVISQLSDSLTYLTFYFQGEPYLHSQFLDMVNHASKKNIYTATSTNGHYLKDDMARATVESGLSRLVISIDGTTQDTYEAYRIGGNLEKVIEGTQNMVRWKKTLRSRTPHIVFQFLVVRQNEHQVPEVYRLAKKLGVNEVKIKTAQIYNYENGSDLLPLNEKYSRYRKTATGSYEIKNDLLNHCWKMWHSCVITWNGKIVPCCFDKDAQFVLGDLTQHSFEEIWRGEKYNDFRNTLLRSRSQTEICKNCTEGTKVWA